MKNKMRIPKKERSPLQANMAAGPLATALMTGLALETRRMRDFSADSVSCVQIA